MRVSQLIGRRQSETIDIDVPVCGPLDVLIEMKLCGVCASELHTWREGGGLFPSRLGHEPYGIVAATGSGVKRFAIGDRVTGLATGAYSQYCLSPEDRLLPVPANVSDAGALGEPLGCLVNAVRRTPVGLADTVILIGAGYMGLGFLQIARLRGATRIIVVDVRRESLDLALTFGATEVYIPEEVPDEWFLTEFSHWSSGRGADVVVEATGTQPGLELAGKLVKPHGVLSILGFHQGGPRAIDVGMWNWKAIDVVNAHVRKRDDLMESMRIGLELESSGQINIGSLVSHRFSLDQVDTAFEALEGKPEGFVKAVVEF